MIKLITRFSGNPILTKEDVRARSCRTGYEHPTFSNGKTWEAGLVTIDKRVVDKIKESITDLNPESAKL